MKSMELFRKHSGPFACVLVLFTALLCTAMLGTLTVIADTEPNDEFATAESIGLGMHTGSVDDTDVNDYYNLTLGGTNLTVYANVTVPGTLTINLYLYNQSQEEVASDIDVTGGVAAVSYTFDTDEWVYVRINQTSGSDTYDMEVAAVDSTPPVIDHEPLTQGWVNNTITITASVTDNVAVNNVSLDYTNVTTGFKDNRTMTLEDGNYTYAIPAPTSTGTIEYFIWANDTSDNENRIANSTITISFDTEPPAITHTPVTSASVGVAFNISAIVTDNAAVAQVNISYTDLNGDPQNVSMTLVAGDTYNYTMPAQTSEGDITYFIWANDKSDNEVRTDNHTITVTEGDTTAPTITHTPVESATADKEVSIEATITDDVSVESATLYYRTEGDTTYTSATMSVSGDTYTATVPASAVTTDGVEYYISATDGVNVATSPAANPETSPHEIEVTEEAPLDMMWIYLALAVIIIIVVIIAVVAASRRRGAPPEEPYEEEEPPTIE